MLWAANCFSSAAWATAVEDGRADAVAGAAYGLWLFTEITGRNRELQALSALAFLIASAAVLRAVSVAYLGGTPDWRDSLRAATTLRELSTPSGTAVIVCRPGIIWYGLVWAGRAGLPKASRSRALKIGLDKTTRFLLSGVLPTPPDALNSW